MAVNPIRRLKHDPKHERMSTQSQILLTPGSQSAGFTLGRDVRFWFRGPGLGVQVWGWQCGPDLGYLWGTTRCSLAGTLLWQAVLVETSRLYCTTVVPALI